MDPQVVEDQKHLSPSICDQALHEIDQDLGIHSAIENPEADFAPVGDRGDQVDRFALGVEPEHRRLALQRIAADMLRVVSQASLITPVDFSILGLGAGVDGRILVLEPLPHAAHRPFSSASAP